MRKPDDRSEGLARLRGRAEGPRLLAAFRDGKVFQKGAHFPENVILLNMLINKDLRKQMEMEKNDVLKVTVFRTNSSDICV